MAKKGARERIKLESSAGTGFFDEPMKNRQMTPDKLDLRTYAPVGPKPSVFKERKLN